MMHIIARAREAQEAALAAEQTAILAAREKAANACNDAVQTEQREILAARERCAFALTEIDTVRVLETEQCIADFEGRPRAGGSAGSASGVSGASAESPSPSPEPFIAIAAPKPGTQARNVEMLSADFDDLKFPSIARKDRVK